LIADYLTVSLENLKLRERIYTMGFKINTEIKPLNETEIKLMSQRELEESLSRLNDTLQEQYVSRGLTEQDQMDISAANNNITSDVIARMNSASLLI
jgi:hypothetical protein